MNVLNRVLRNGPPRLINQGGFPDSFQVNGRWQKFIVLSPQIKNGINGNTSTIAPSTIEALIQYAKSTYRIDTTKIYLSGLSMGGGATWDYAGSSTSAANRLAAIIVACGAGDLSQEEANNIAAAKLPVLATHNQDDQVIVASRTQNNINNILNYTPTINPLPRAIYWTPPPSYGHNVWRRTFEELQPGFNGGDVTDSLGLDAYRWALQFARVTVALPVNWIEFTASKSGSGIHLHWEVNAQEKVKDYNIEKSEDGRAWKDIVSLQAKSGSGELRYDYDDNSNINGRVYYRIKVNDLNGQSTYSVIRVVNVEAGNKMLVYPNPFKRNLSIQLPLSLTGQFELRLIDDQGKIVYERNQVANNSIININVPDGLKTGNYFMQLISSSGKTFQSKLLIRQ